jgi:fatty-acyl-CoA synthase
MTETASIAFLPRLNDPPEIAIGTVGRPLEGLDMRIVNPEDGSPVEPGAAGLLQLRGPQVMSEYHNKPEETAKAFDDDGWFRTGDMAQVDAAGNLTFIGRRSDHFKVGGEYVDPAEVEAALQSHPAVERAAVVGVPDDRLGNVTYAWVKFRRTASRDYPETSAEALIEHTRSRVAFFKVPRAVYVVEEFPVTPSGKIQKFKLTDSLKDADR